MAQESVILGARASIAQSRKHIAQITADYLRQLQAERVETATALEKLHQELAKLERRHELLELKAPQDAIVKDLATHTLGTVASPGTILMTLVPKDEVLRAEVWVTNQDIGFVQAEQPVRLKLAAFQFQEHGLIDGSVAQVSADAADRLAGNGTPQAESENRQAGAALV